MVFAIAPCIATVAHAQSLTSAAQQSLTLQQVLDSVAANHPSMRATRASVNAARGARRTAGVFGNPVLSYEVDDTPFPGQGPVGLDREDMTTVTLPLDVLYQRGPRVSRANAQLRTAEADAMLARQRLAIDAATAFYRVALAQVGVNATRDLTAWLDSLVAYNRTRVREGAAAEADLIRAELERDRTAADAALEEAELQRARADLSVFLGDVPRLGSEVVVAAPSTPLGMPVSDTGSTTEDARAPMRASATTGDTLATAALEDAIARRPDVRSARERVQAAEAGVSIERSMFLRQLGATIGTKRTAGTTSMIAGVSLPVPLFDQNRGEVERASAEREVASLELAAQERRARADLSGAYAAAQLLTIHAATLARGGQGAYLARADEARHISLGAYREGAVPLIQVLDAARARGEARVAYYRVLYAQHESVIALRAAEGEDLFSGVLATSPAPALPPGQNR